MNYFKEYVGKHKTMGKLRKKELIMKWNASILGYETVAMDYESAQHHRH